ncbi:sensor histidine kinase, partial [Streptomyces sparsus]
ARLRPGRFGNVRNRVRNLRPGRTGGPHRTAATTGNGPAGRTTVPLQANALQSLCRHVFGFRLAMIALGTPMALANTADGLPKWLVGSAVLVTFMGSYALFRDWERFGPLLLRHPPLLAVDLLLSGLLLVTATPQSPLAYVCVCTPLLAGLLYGWRGAGAFAAAQCLLLTVLYATAGAAASGAAGATDETDGQELHSALLLAGFCAIAGAVGVTLRNHVLRFATASQALAEARARLAATTAVAEERARLARDLHDSVAKTLHGLALSADSLARTADRAPAPEVRQRAELVARSARRAAAESRDLLTDLRHSGEPGRPVGVVPALHAATEDFSRRTGITATFHHTGPVDTAPAVTQAVASHLLTVTTEALDNVARHAKATTVTVTTALADGLLTLRIRDNGTGLPPGTTLPALSRSGHFGLLGMVERAAAIGARLRVGRSSTGGTEVRLDLPHAPRSEAPEGSPHHAA